MQHRQKQSGPASTPASRDSRVSRGGLALALLALTLVFFLPALRAGYIWDDSILTDNPLISGSDGLFKFWFHPAENVHETHYWPLVYTMFWAEYRFWGVNPLGYHLVNV